MVSITPEQAIAFSKLPLEGIVREYPHIAGPFLNGPEDLKPIRSWNPAFHGCLDWHSAVHSHWALVKLMRNFALPDEALIRSRLNGNLTAENILVEVDYLRQRRHFERMYGWAWLLKFALELRDWDDADGRSWALALKPLEELVVELYLEYLPKLEEPNRSGLHGNTAFGLIFAYDYAVVAGNETLRALIADKAQDFYRYDDGGQADERYGQADFLSPRLVEADLMRRILDPDDFRGWLYCNMDGSDALLTPVVVPDRSDPYGNHLDGLNLSRAWCFSALAEAMRGEERYEPFAAQCEAAARAHAAAGFAHVVTGDYMGEHWLASFATYLAVR